MRMKYLSPKNIFLVFLNDTKVKYGESWNQLIIIVKKKMLRKSKVENDTKVKKEKAEIDNHCEEENVKERD